MRLPELDELLGLRAAARASGLRVRGSARAPLLGSHRGAHRGRGLDFEEVRPYVAGDDARSIDWRVTARRGRLHTKLYREERERPVWLLVDLQPGMFFGTRRQLKSALAVRAAALLAWAITGGGDRVGAIVATGTQMHCHPPRAREAGVLPLLRSLVDLQPRAPAEPRAAALEEALRTALPLVRPGSLVLAISDFAGAGAAIDPHWLSLGAHAECRLYWITDALEERGLPDGRFRGGIPGQLRPLGGAAARARWIDGWRERGRRVQAIAERLRGQPIRLDTGERAEEVLPPLLRSAQFAA
ncbi:MAG TPA: DUF58 domain-containing protein [Steroidobacteraceae bacterium]|nr:DUF58 domain-containing protein [Steroidobacteraceae bacterium]